MAANTDLLRKSKSNFSTSLAAPGCLVGDTTINFTSLTGLPVDTAVEVTIDRVDSNGNKTPNAMERVIGVVSGNQLVNCLRGAEGTQQAHAAGAIVEIIWDARTWNDLLVGLLTSHNQDGAVKAVTEITNNNYIQGFNAAGNAAINMMKVGTDDKIRFDAGGGASDFLNGWLPCDETWTYVNATQITSPVTVTGKYQNGDKIRLKQGAGFLYFYVTAVSYVSLTLTLTLFAGTSFTLANAVITSNSFSKATNPQGFPSSFNYTPVPIPSVGTVTVTSNYRRNFTIQGSLIYVETVIIFTTSQAIPNVACPLPLPHIAPDFVLGTVASFGSPYLINISNLLTRVYANNVNFDNANYSSGVNNWLGFNFSYLWT
jgi:hypothetical protein